MDVGRAVLTIRLPDGCEVRSLSPELNGSRGQATGARWDACAAKSRALGSHDSGNPVFWAALETESSSMPPFDPTSFQVKTLFILPYEYFSFNFSLRGIVPC